jgi:hypothetical protein
LPVSGRDELKAGEMWNSVIAWLIFTADLPTDTLRGLRPSPERDRAVVRLPSHGAAARANQDTRNT